MTDQNNQDNWKGKERREGRDRRTGEDRRSKEERRIAPRREQDRTGTGAGQVVKIDLPDQTDYISVLRRFVGGIARQAGFSRLDSEQIELAVDEACSHVLEHAYQFKEGCRYVLEVNVGTNHMDIVITDQGEAFNLETENNWNPNEQLAELKVGGLGVYIMKKVMDGVEYGKSEAGNVLKLMKYIKKVEG